MLNVHRSSIHKGFVPMDLLWPEYEKVCNIHGQSAEVLTSYPAFLMGRILKNV